MFSRILQLIAWRVASRFTSEFQLALAPAVGYVRRVGIGLLIVVLSGVAFLASLSFILLGLFFYLSQADGFMAPAFWTSLMSGIVGLILVFFGLHFIRRPME